MDKTIDMAREAGFELDCTSLEWHKRIKAFEALVRADEREACAKVCEGLPMQQEVDVRDECAAAIRARSCPPCNDDCDQGRNCPARGNT